MIAVQKLSRLIATLIITITSVWADLPDPGMIIDPQRTALVVTDPQNDFLSPNGVTWGVVGKSVEANNTVEHIEQLFKAAKAKGLPVMVSPHYYYQHDHQWKFEGALEMANANWDAKRALAEIAKAK